MYIKKENLDKLIKELLLEQDLDYINPFRYFVDKNVNLKAYKTEVFKQLEDVYKDSPISEFLGVMTRDVGRVVKKIYNDPSYGFSDRDFLQNEVKKFHYVPFGNVEQFLSEAAANSKNEISTVGYTSTDKIQTGAFGKQVAVQLEGYVSFAANTNLVSGGKPSKSDLEKYKHSGVPKFPDNSMTKSVVQSIPLIYTLTNHINFVLDNVIFDSDTFTSAKDRVSSLIPMRKGHITTSWNEFILDNWKPVGLLIDEKSEKYPETLEIIKKRVPEIAQKYNLPIVKL